MPVLPVLDEAGELDQLAGLKLQAVMFYPRDEDWQDQFIGAAGKKIIIETVEQENKCPRESIYGEINVLSHAPDLEYFVRNKKAIRQRGFCAGHWLWHMITVRVHHPEHASNLKWQYLMANYVLKRHNENNPGDRWAISDQRIFSFRNEFLPVAHLWAATEVFKDMGTIEYAVDNEILLHFLSCSEEFRKKANELHLFDDLRCGFWSDPLRLDRNGTEKGAG